MHVNTDACTADSHVLHLPPSARRDEAAARGRLISLLTQDALKVEQAVLFTHRVWLSPLAVLAGLGYIYMVIGIATVAGFAFMCLALVPVNCIKKLQQQAQRAKMQQADRRAKLVEETFSAMKVVKYYGWEGPQLHRLQGARQKELMALRRFKVRHNLQLDEWHFPCLFSNLRHIDCAFLQFFEAFSGPVNVTIPIVTSVVTFVVYALLGHEITPPVAFTVVSLFQIVRNPFGQIPQTLTLYTQLSTALQRLSALFELPQRDDAEQDMNWRSKTYLSERIGRNSSSHRNSASVDIVVQTLPARFTWGTQHGAWGLQMPELALLPGDLIAVVGAVGAGKSSLLQAMLGHMTCQESASDKKSAVVWGGIRGYRICYAAQEPFLVSGSVRENILGGEPYDATVYNSVLSDCALSPDLEQLPDGEWTEIGERGVGLSGGQKARIGLARAVYRVAKTIHETPVVLLDDPFSAVDAHVGSILMQRVVQKRLARATVLLVTNQLQLLRLANPKRILVLQNGEIAESGTFDELMATDNNIGGIFQGMLRDTGAQSEATLTTPDASLSNYPQKGPQPVQKVEMPQSGQSQRKLATAKSSEETGQGAVKSAAFLAYAAAGTNGSLCRFCLLMFGFVVAEICFVAIDSWLSIWADDRLEVAPSVYILVYVSFTVFYFGVTLVRSLAVASFGVESSKHLYDAMQTRAMYCPMRWYETTPLGRLLNRFTKDISDVDDALAGSFTWFLMCLLRVVSICTVIGIIQPPFLVALILVFKLYHSARKLYRGSARQLQRIEAVTRSPLYSHAAETIDGWATVRAHDDEFRFREKFAILLRDNLTAFWAQQATASWFSLQLQLLGSVVVGSCAICLSLGLGPNGTVSAGLVGLALSYSNNIVINLNGCVFDWVQAEAKMVGVERILEYATQLPQEPHTPNQAKYSRVLQLGKIWRRKIQTLDQGTDLVPGRYSQLRTTTSLPSDWPRFGELELQEVSMRYSSALPLVLERVSFRCAPGQLVGVVGRTGSGKSSLFACLFRLINQLDSGAILIDGVNIETVRLEKLRPAISIIPQEPVLFAGSVRSNVDMLGTEKDEHIWKAITAARLEGVIARLPLPTPEGRHAQPNRVTEHANNGTADTAMPGNLDSMVDSRGANFSVGERQLLCMARVCLRQSRLVLLDEATASVDPATDHAIQATIRNEPSFTHATRIVIAHRLMTIIDADQVIVMQNGKVVENGPPVSLLEHKNKEKCGLFKQLVDESGIDVDEVMHKRAERLQ
eukprot:SAG31_NODE_854_length_11497_cov_8.245043_8_plen_1259_part_00